jgi:hypothetical protein
MAWLKLVAVVKAILDLINKIYDEYIRAKYRKEGRAEQDALARSQMSSDAVARKEIAAKVDTETEDEVNAGLIDPRK